MQAKVQQRWTTSELKDKNRKREDAGEDINRMEIKCLFVWLTKGRKNDQQGKTAE